MSVVRLTLCFAIDFVISIYGSSVCWFISFSTSISTSELFSTNLVFLLLLLDRVLLILTLVDDFLYLLRIGGDFFAGDGTCVISLGFLPYGRSTTTSSSSCDQFLASGDLFLEETFELLASTSWMSMLSFFFFKINDLFTLFVLYF